MTIDCYEAAVNAPVREIFEIPGATHIQTYWKPDYVSQAVGKLVEFFGSNL
jgi:alpha/beta hydrolase family protein